MIIKFIFTCTNITPALATHFNFSFFIPVFFKLLAATFLHPGCFWIIFLTGFAKTWNNPAKTKNPNINGLT